MFQVKNLNPFITQTLDMFEQFGVFREAKKKDTKLLKAGFETDGKQIEIGITGDLKGTYMLEFQDTDLACKLATGMSGMEMNEFDDFTLSAVKESVNIICGKSLIKLQDLDKSCNITPPEFREGDFTTKLSNPALKVIYETEESIEFSIIISLT